MQGRRQRQSRSETKRRKRAELYFDLFPEKKPQELPGGEKMMDIKKEIVNAKNVIQLILFLVLVISGCVLIVSILHTNKMSGYEKEN